MSCVDWMSTLRLASFRGVPFQVSTDDLEVGRRLKVWEFPNRDRPFIEDMGEKAITYSVRAYIAEDALIGRQKALMSACRRRGPGTLTLPTDGSQRVRCKSARRTHEKDKLGFIAFQLEFVEAGLGLSASPVALLERLVSVAVTGAITSIADAFLREYNLIRQDDWVIASSVARIQDWAETVDTLRSDMNLTTDALGTVGRLVETFHDDALTLSKDGADTVSITQTALGLTSETANGGTIVTRAYEIVEALREGSVTEQDAFEGLEVIAEYSTDETRPAAVGKSGARDEENLEALNSMFRRLALSEMAVAGAEADWGDREKAVNARATVAEIFENELHNARGRTSVYQSLSEVRNKSIKAISSKLADLDPVVVVESAAVMPSIVWAYRLYEDATRATDLISRNRIAHPSYMPTEFEAEAPPDTETTAAERRSLLGV